MKISFKKVLLSALLGTQIQAFAQPPATQPAPKTGVSEDGGPIDTMGTQPKSLLEMRLHEASAPGEAELRCGLSEPCAMGLAYNFYLGADLTNLAFVPLLYPMQTPGSWLYYDAFAGYQFLRGIGEGFYANGSIGYRGFSYEDSDERKVESKGLTFRINYAQVIYPQYTQSVALSGYLGRAKFSDESKIYELESSDNQDDARQAVKRFYKFSQRYPRVRVGFPADIEVINWRDKNIDLPNHLRGYVRLEPYYIQNDLILDVDGYAWNEKNFGLRSTFSLAYESEPAEKLGRFAALASIGPEFSTSTMRFSEGEKSAEPKFDLPSRRAVDLHFEVMASYQF